MSLGLKLTPTIVAIIMLGNVASAASDDPQIRFSLTDGTGEPSDTCIARARSLAEQMESGSVAIKKLRHSEMFGPTNIHPKEYISVTYELPDDQLARLFLTCHYGLPLTASETQSGEVCIELSMLSFPENTEAGVQDSFTMRLDDYGDYGGEAGAELFARMVDQYRQDNNPVRAALTGHCADIE